MNERVVITIGREYGSGGREIGEKLSEKLGIGFYDRNILELAAKESGISPENLENEEEKAANPLWEPYVPYGISAGNLSEKLFDLESKIILEKAKEESCVIVGRCSDVILRDFENAVHVFIYSDMEDKIERVMKRDSKMERQHAIKTIKKYDKIRRTYYQYYTEYLWGSKEGQDLLINSGKTGIDGAVELICSYLKIRGLSPE